MANSKVFRRAKKPILLSTGLADLEEVIQTVKYLQKIEPEYQNPGMLCVLQCTAMYPISDNEAHLLVMDDIRSTTGLSVGYSDHTIGSEALKTATAMGAEVLEFHFTTERENKSFRDHQISLLENEVSKLKSDIEKIVALRGNPIKRPQKSEIDNAHLASFRRGVYLARTAQKGDIIGMEDLICLRPAAGTDARDIELLDGAVALRIINPLEAIVEGVDFVRAKDERSN